MTREEGWREQAACVGHTALFFAEVNEKCSQRMYDDAAQLCAVCPVIGPCREYAMTEASPRFGYIAGMTPLQRRNYRKARRRVA